MTSSRLRGTLFGSLDGVRNIITLLVGNLLANTVYVPATLTTDDPSVSKFMAKTLSEESHSPEVVNALCEVVKGGGIR